VAHVPSDIHTLSLHDALPICFYDIGNWTSSFFTGMALIAWQETEDEYFLKQVQRLAVHYSEKVFTHNHQTHHDLGFLYSLYSVEIGRAHASTPVTVRPRMPSS